MVQYALYIHVPLCQSKCGYCDFYSVAIEERGIQPLISRMVADLQHRVTQQQASVRTIFVGGGTPTVVPIGELRTLFGELRGIVDGNQVREFTVEANPATLDDEKLAVLTATGVDRLSLGAQSWHVQELAALERLHSPGDITNSVKLSRDHALDNINIDLIFGIPGQTLSSWRDSLQRTIDLGVEHVSCYGLSYEPGTRLSAQLNSGRIKRCDEDLEADMYLQAMDTLATHGFEHYEISNFARPHRRCLHNMAYWRNEPYIGVGPSAVGFINCERYRNVPDIEAYIRSMDRYGHAVCESEHVSGARLAGEMVMMQLRLNEGVDVTCFSDRTGIDPRQAFKTSLARYIDMGLVIDSGRSLSLTQSGRLVADTIISDFYAELNAVDGQV